MPEKKKESAREWDHENDCWIEPKKEKAKDK